MQNGKCKIYVSFPVIPIVIIGILFRWFRADLIKNDPANLFPAMDFNQDTMQGSSQFLNAYQQEAHPPPNGEKCF
jgi:hypothetical protein